MGLWKLLRWHLNLFKKKHVTFEYIGCKMAIVSFGPNKVKFQRTDNHKTDGSYIVRQLTYPVLTDAYLSKVHFTSYPRRCNYQHHRGHPAAIVNVFKYDHTYIHSLTDNQIHCQVWQGVSYCMWTCIFVEAVLYYAWPINVVVKG